MSALGEKQLRQLGILACPGNMLVSGPNRQTRSLVKRGLCTAEPDGNGVTITAAGLRALADAADAGRVDLRPMRGRAR